MTASVRTNTSACLHSVTQVAELVGLSTTVVYRAIAAGELRASKLRGRIRVRASDIDNWLDSNVIEPTEHRRTKRVTARSAGGRAAGGRGLRELLSES